MFVYTPQMFMSAMTTGQGQAAYAYVLHTFLTGNDSDVEKVADLVDQTPTYWPDGFVKLVRLHRARVENQQLDDRRRVLVREWERRRLEEDRWLFERNEDERRMDAYHNVAMAQTPPPADRVVGAGPS
ncbi:MAG: hypothetical protein EOM37_04745 [Proteobacteria bacterium]|nr:hypothetical protein [Alphaproteobacteria bacterium]NCC03340.1 hypothetical protein [Pseudomonadota bacterium]